MLEKDKGLLYQIYVYCKRIMRIKKRIKRRNSFKIDELEIISFNLIQIGECISKLSDEFKLSNNKIPWNKAVGLRNRVVHGYGSIDPNIIFDTANNDIPILIKLCKENL